MYVLPAEGLYITCIQLHQRPAESIRFHLNLETFYLHYCSFGTERNTENYGTISPAPTIDLYPSSHV